MTLFSEETLPKNLVGGGDSVVLLTQSLNGPVARPELYDGSSRTFLIDENTPAPSETEQLRERIRYLEAYTYELNQAQRSFESDKRTHEATLRMLEITKIENEVLRNDRDKNFNENEFNKQNAEEMSRKVEYYKERISELNRCLVQSKEEADEKIVRLKNELTRWKRKYENDVVIPIREGVALTGAPRTGQPRTSSPTNQEIENKGNQKASNTDVQSPERKRKCSFYKFKTRLPWCKNCKTIFDKLEPYQVDCRFHRSFPQPLKAWQHNSVMEDKKVPGVSTQPYKFWPCCEKTSIREPPGCLKLKQHDVVYPDQDDVN